MVEVLQDDVLGHENVDFALALPHFLQDRILSQMQQGIQRSLSIREIVAHLSIEAPLEVGRSTAFEQAWADRGKETSTRFDLIKQRIDLPVADRGGDGLQSEYAAPEPFILNDQSCNRLARGHLLQHRHRDL